MQPVDKTMQSVHKQLCCPRRADLNESRWKVLYRVGAACIFLAVIVMVTEIFLTALPDGSTATAGASTIIGWFDLFQRNWFMAMRN
jgi:hypothetical protein